MKKHLDFLREARENGEKIKIMEFYERCQKDGHAPPKIMKEVIKNGLQGVLVK
ncbi:MAG: hypothetical protein ACRC51_03985 [Cetobacterium sp.]